MIAVFKKKNGRFLSFIDVDLEKIKKNPDYIYKDMGDFDTSMYTWSGDYENGKLVELHDKEDDTMFEGDVDETNRLFINKLYNIQTQINIIVKQINSMVFEPNGDFEKLARVLQECERINGIYKETYNNSDRIIYKTYSELKKDRDKSFTGGFAETMLGKHEIDMVAGDEDDKDII